MAPGREQREVKARDMLKGVWDHVKVTRVAAEREGGACLAL